MSKHLQMSHLQNCETNNEIKVSLHTDQTNKAYAHNKILAFLGNTLNRTFLYLPLKNIL